MHLHPVRNLWATVSSNCSGTGWNKERARKDKDWERVGAGGGGGAGKCGGDVCGALTSFRRSLSSQFYCSFASLDAAAEGSACCLLAKNHNATQPPLDGRAPFRFYIHFAWTVKRSLSPLQSCHGSCSPGAEPAASPVWRGARFRGILGNIFWIQEGKGKRRGCPSAYFRRNNVLLELRSPWKNLVFISLPKLCGLIIRNRILGRTRQCLVLAGTGMLGQPLWYTVLLLSKLSYGWQKSMWKKYCRPCFPLLCPHTLLEHNLLTEREGSPDTGFPCAMLDLPIAGCIITVVNLPLDG